MIHEKLWKYFMNILLDLSNVNLAWSFEKLDSNVTDANPPFVNYVFPLKPLEC